MKAMKTLNEVFDQYIDDKKFLTMLTTTDPSDEQIVKFLRAHDCNANASEAVGFLAGLLSDVPEGELADEELEIIGGGCGRVMYTIENFM